MNSELIEIDFVFEVVWDRICKLTGWKSYGQLADFLKIKSASVSGAKKRGYISLEWIFKVAQSYGVSTDWLATGKGEVKHDTKADRGIFKEVVSGFNPRHDAVKKSLESLHDSASSRIADASASVMESKTQSQFFIKRDQPHAWFHDWIEEELQGKSISEVMAVAVKIKSVLDESKGE